MKKYKQNVRAINKMAYLTARSVFPYASFGSNKFRPKEELLILISVSIQACGNTRLKCKTFQSAVKPLSEISLLNGKKFPSKEGFFQGDVKRTCVCFPRGVKNKYAEPLNCNSI